MRPTQCLRIAHTHPKTPIQLIRSQRPGAHTYSGYLLPVTIDFSWKDQTPDQWICNIVAFREFNLLPRLVIIPNALCFFGWFHLCFGCCTSRFNLHLGHTYFYPHFYKEFAVQIKKLPRGPPLPLNL